MTVTSVGLLLALLAPEATAPAPPPPAFPRVYCAYASEPEVDWTLVINPVTQADLDQAERLWEAYPEADGMTQALRRSNIPAQWRGIDEVTLLSDDGPVHASTRSTGVIASPAGGAFVFRLNRRPGLSTRALGLAIDGHHELSTRSWRFVPTPTPRIDEDRFDALRTPLARYIRTRRPRAGTPWLGAPFVRWIEADFGGGVEAIVITGGNEWSAIAAVHEGGGLLDVPAGTRAPTGGAPGVVEYARFEAVAIVDLDGNGREELMVHEQWYEGRYTWLIRYDDASKSVVADLVCGDAA